MMPASHAPDFHPDSIASTRRVRRLAGSAVALLVAALATPAAWANDWETPGLDLAHARFTSERSGALFGDGLWESSAPPWTLASPVVADGFLVTANLDGVVSALRADSGEPVWQVSLPSTVHGTPTLARGRVFVPAVSNMLYALRLADGAILWKRDIGGMTMSSPTPVDADIVVAPGFPKMNVVRLSGETGEIVWESPVMWQFSNTAPAVGNGLVVVGSQQGHYYAFDAATGSLRWEHVADGIVHLAAPVILGGRVYMAGGDQSNRVHAVELATGKAAPGWPINLPTPAPDIAGTRYGGWRAVSSFAAAGGLLLLQTRLDDALGTRATGPFNYLSREVVVALDPASGALVWQHTLARAERADVNDVPKFYVCPTPAAYGTDNGSALVAVASSLDPMVAVLDVATGIERGRHAVAGPALASPVIANGRLYATSLNGTTQSLGSSVNHAPTAPVAGTYANPINLSNLTLGWSSAADHDSEAASYELRIDQDGEILSDWQEQRFIAAGMTSTRIATSFVPGVTYTFAVRARDPHGAMSPWSTPATFTVTDMGGGTMDIAGTPGGMGPPPAGMGPPPAGMGPPPAGMGPTMADTMMGMAVPPTIAITQPTMTTDEQAVDGTGCSIGGRTGNRWAAGLVLGLIVALRARRRK